MQKPSRREIQSTQVSRRPDVIEYKRKYHIENRDKILKKVRKHYEENREQRLAYGREWRKQNKDKMRLYRRKSIDKLKEETFEAYGGAFCACCGESGVFFLTIDHIEGGGADHRKSLNSRGGKGFYSWLRKNNFPSGYQVLCFNCNMAKGTMEHCPHKDIPPITIRPL